MPKEIRESTKGERGEKRSGADLEMGEREGWEKKVVVKDLRRGGGKIRRQGRLYLMYLSVH